MGVSHSLPSHIFQIVRPITDTNLLEYFQTGLFWGIPWKKAHKQSTGKIKKKMLLVPFISQEHLLSSSRALALTPIFIWFDVILYRFCSFVIPYITGIFPIPKSVIDWKISTDYGNLRAHQTRRSGWNSRPISAEVTLPRFQSEIKVALFLFASQSVYHTMIIFQWQYALTP